MRVEVDVEMSVGVGLFEEGSSDTEVLAVPDGPIEEIFWRKNRSKDTKKEFVGVGHDDK